MISVKEWIKDRFKYSEERLDICRTCEFYTEGSSQCKMCGCFMDYKSLLPFSSCPLGKWKSELIEQHEETTEQK